MNITKVDAMKRLHRFNNKRKNVRKAMLIMIVISILSCLTGALVIVPAISVLLKPTFLEPKKLTEPEDKDSIDNNLKIKLQKREAI